MLKHNRESPYTENSIQGGKIESQRADGDAGNEHTMCQLSHTVRTTQRIVRLPSLAINPLQLTGILRSSDDRAGSVLCPFSLGLVHFTHKSSSSCQTGTSWCAALDLIFPDTLYAQPNAMHTVGPQNACWMQVLN